MPKRNKERATADNVAERISQLGTLARIPKALAARARLDAYEQTPPAERFVGLASVGEEQRS